MDNKISFIGVGPGDPELLTLKALKKIKIADVIIWTDSLIPEKILDCLLYTSDAADDP